MGKSRSQFGQEIHPGRVCFLPQVRMRFVARLKEIAERSGFEIEDARPDIRHTRRMPNDELLISVHAKLKGSDREIGFDEFIKPGDWEVAV